MPKVTGKTGFRPVRDIASMTVSMNVVDAEGELKDKEVYSFSEVAKDLQAEVSLYGLQKLLMDRTSQITDSFRSKLEGMDKVMGGLVLGEWKAERESGPRSVSPEVEALAKLKGVSIPAIQKSLTNYTDEQRKKILANPKVLEAASIIRTEREAGQPVDLLDMAK